MNHEKEGAAAVDAPTARWKAGMQHTQYMGHGTTALSQHSKSLFCTIDEVSLSIQWLTGSMPTTAKLTA